MPQSPGRQRYLCVALTNLVQTRVPQALTASNRLHTVVASKWTTLSK